MATLSTTEDIPGDNGLWVIRSEIDLDTGKIETTITSSKGESLVKGTPEYVVNHLNKVLSKVKGTPIADSISQAITIVTDQSARLTSQYQQQVPPVTKENNADGKPAASSTQATPQEETNKFVGKGGTPDDAAPPAPAAPNTNPSTNEGSNTTNAQSASKLEDDGTPTNKRRYNPLSKYASYTYQISLYMISSAGYDNFINSGTKTIEDGYLIAQSGGIGDDQKRAPGFKFDYYIDDLKIKAAINPQATGFSTVETEMSFSITEPYGFSFITNLKQAATAISGNDPKAANNPSRQFYILGIKFLGYDAAGNLIQDSDGSYERNWGIIIRSMKFKLDGRASTYHIEATPTDLMTAFGVKRGTIALGAVAQGSTVRDALDGNNPKQNVFGILTKMNQDEQANKSIKQKNKWSVEFIGEGSDKIANASIFNKSDLDKSKFPMANVKRLEEVNASLEVKAVPNTGARQITFKSQTPVLQAIQQIIMQSTYLTDALNTDFKSVPQPDQETDRAASINDASKDTVKWYNVSARVSNARFDDDPADYAFDITYFIQPYSAPALLTPFADKLPKYYGPVKRYDYWYTGENSEILSYTQELNNLYYNVMFNANLSNKVKMATGGPAQIPAKTDVYSNAIRQGEQGPGLQAQAQIASQLTDPSAYAEARMQILGDPDWLMNTTIPKSTADYNPYYGIDGYTINPTGGQVFVEVDFREAVDYTGSGVLDLNNNIVFWEYSPEVKKKYKIKGVSYRVIKVDSTLSKGRFIQDLYMVINNFSDTESGKGTSSERQSDEQSTTTPAAPTTQPSTAKPTAPVRNKIPNTTKQQTTGLTPYQPVAPNPPPPKEKPITPPADDDFYVTPMGDIAFGRPLPNAADSLPKNRNRGSNN